MLNMVKRLQSEHSVFHHLLVLMQPGGVVEAFEAAGRTHDFHEVASHGVEIEV